MHDLVAKYEYGLKRWVLVTILLAAVAAEIFFLWLVLTIDAKDDMDKQAALWEASLSADLHVVRSLVEEGADVNTSSEGGTTVLMRASISGKLDVVRFLVENGADVDAFKIEIRRIRGQG